MVAKDLVRICGAVQDSIYGPGCCCIALLAVKQPTLHPHFTVAILLHHHCEDRDDNGGSCLFTLPICSKPTTQEWPAWLCVSVWSHVPGLLFLPLLLPIDLSAADLRGLVSVAREGQRIRCTTSCQRMSPPLVRAVIFASQEREGASAV